MSFGRWCLWGACPVGNDKRARFEQPRCPNCKPVTAPIVARGLDDDDNLIIQLPNSPNTAQRMRSLRNRLWIHTGIITIESNDLFVNIKAGVYRAVDAIGWRVPIGQPWVYVYFNNFIGIPIFDSESGATNDD